MRLGVKWKIVFVVIFASFLLLLYTIFYMLSPLTARSAVFPSVLVVQPGWSLAQISVSLERQGLNPNPRLYRTCIWLSGFSRSLQAGEYALGPGSSLWSVTQAMHRGSVLLHRFTIVEGWDWQALRVALQTSDFLDDDVDVDQVSSWPLLAGQMEGWFLPDTYQVPRGQSATHLLHQAHEAMVHALIDLWPSCDASYCGYQSQQDLLTLASLVEKEAGVVDEMPRIAGVMCRRLQLGMPLQVDASVRYGLHWPKRLLMHQDLRIDTPFNTYMHRGLPPTAIAMPGLEALVAACHPHRDRALYYVISAGGRHRFSETYDEHRRAVADYRRHYRLQFEDSDARSAAS